MSTSSSEAHHLFAWDGFSMQVPANWDLSFYFFDIHSSSIRLEDEAAVRLEMEWTRPVGAMNAVRVRERYLKRLRAIDAIVRESREVDRLPSGWHAFLHVMPDGRCLVTALWIAPRDGFVALMKLHFSHEGTSVPVRVYRHIAASFALADGDLIPWAAYDMVFTLHRAFRIETTTLEAGRKRFVFRRRLRRLHLWQVSIADLLLRDGRSPAQWAAAFLNDGAFFKSTLFAADDAGGISARRRRRYPLGHFDEIGRWCFRYAVDCVHLAEKNAILLAVFNYRGPGDRDWIASLRASMRRGV
jgi:hypothetical protein